MIHDLCICVIRTFRVNGLAAGHKATLMRRVSGVLKIVAGRKTDLVLLAPRCILIVMIVVITIAVEP